METPPSFESEEISIREEYNPIASNDPANRPKARPVDYTISADRADGQVTHTVLGLARLATDNKIIKNSVADHQMQLMLLEQQNKKRLMLMRQEQDLAMRNREEWARLSQPEPSASNPGSGDTVKGKEQPDNLSGQSRPPEQRKQFEQQPGQPEKPEQPE
ncbi:hypothetical protein VTH82DRAFT_1681 [Thermothelomyces myriococcoides]